MAWKPQNDVAMAEIKKIDGFIAQVETDKKDMIYQIGETFFKKYKDSENMDEELKILVDNIKISDTNRKVWINRQMKLQGLRICEGCGNVLPYDSMFCNRCGIKLGPVAEDLVQLKGVAPMMQPPV